jgi:hypothetical protein
MFFSLFLAFSLLFCAFYYKNTMDECKHKILMVLVFIMAIHRVITQVISLQQVTIIQHCSSHVAIFFRVCGHATKSLKHMEVLEGS